MSLPKHIIVNELYKHLSDSDLLNLSLLDKDLHKRMKSILDERKEEKRKRKYDEIQSLRQEVKKEVGYELVVPLLNDVRVLQKKIHLKSKTKLPRMSVAEENEVFKTLPIEDLDEIIKKQKEAIHFMKKLFTPHF